MKLRIQKEAKKFLRAQDIDVYLLVCVDALLLCGALLGQSKFLYGFWAPVLLMTSVAILVSMLLRRLSFKINHCDYCRDIYKSVFMRTLLLFALPHILLQLSGIQFIIAFGIIAWSFSFFFRVFKLEILIFTSFIALIATYTVYAGRETVIASFAKLKASLRGLRIPTWVFTLLPAKSQKHP